MAHRVNIRITDQVYDKTAIWAEKLGITKSQLMGMAIQAGIDSIIRAVSPVDSISPDQWANLMKAYEGKKEKED